MECVTGKQIPAETLNTDSDSHLERDETASEEEVDAAVRVASSQPLRCRTPSGGGRPRAMR
eukprot:1239506-Amphidinium_carterae.1